MTRRHALATAWAACHLALVAGAAGHLHAWLEAGPTGPAVRLYGALSGSENGYGFFAPGVGSQVRLTVTLRDRAGRERSVSPAGDRRGEVKLRLLALLGMLRSEHEALQDVLAASWAGTCLAHHPEAGRATVRVDVYHLPTMARTRGGERPRWERIYQSTFAYDAEGPPSGEL